jgi:hypothetical protein
LAVIDSGAFVVGKRDGDELQVVLGLPEQGLGGVFGGGEVALCAGHSVRALLEEGVAAEPVAQVVVLPRFSGHCSAGGDGVAVEEDLDGADVAFEVAGVLVGAGQRVGCDLLWRPRLLELSECPGSWSWSAADVCGVGGPVSGGGVLPGDGDADVDAEHPGEQGCG